MKTKLKLLALLTFFTLVGLTSQAQTADEIINNYFENTGGLENWLNMKAVKMSGKIDVGGGNFVPFDLYRIADGQTGLVISFQGQTIYQNMFDGETLWSTNFQNMKAEKSDKETAENFKLNANDFPSSFTNYKEKGYKVELLGKEIIDGTETFKIKLTTEPETVNGKKVNAISFHYFDTENFVLIQEESLEISGPSKGMVTVQKVGDYQEVDGLYFPFSMEFSVKGQPSSQALKIEKIELNPDVKESFFKFPDN